jgi:hypothetical protein
MSVMRSPSVGGHRERYDKSKHNGDRILPKRTQFGYQPASQQDTDAELGDSCDPRCSRLCYTKENSRLKTTDTRAPLPQMVIHFDTEAAFLAKRTQFPDLESSG